MSLADDLLARLPFAKSNQVKEYFFALNIGPTYLTTALWTVNNGVLQVLNPVSEKYSGSEEIVNVADRLLDQAMGTLQAEPEKILFGVPDSWLLDDDLKENYLKLLQSVVKSLDLKPMAYVASSHAIAHLIEKTDGAPTTAILVGINAVEATVTVVRAGKVDGTKVVKRTDKLGEEIEKALLGFTEVEVLPSRILAYNLPGDREVDLDKQKANLLSYPWMTKLSFLHFPKIETVKSQVVVDSVALAGASEIDPNVKYHAQTSLDAGVLGAGLVGAKLSNLADQSAVSQQADEVKEVEEAKEADLGFVEGDVATKTKVAEPETNEEAVENVKKVAGADDFPTDLTGEEEETYAVEQSSRPLMNRTPPLPTEFEESELTLSNYGKFGFLKRFLFSGRLKLLIIPLVLILLALAYLFLSQAKVTIFVEPKIVENDTQVTADPAAKSVNENTKTIPGQVVSTEISGTDSAPATGTKKIGDPAKGTVTIYNKTSSPKTFSKGDSLKISSGAKFTLNQEVNIASESANDTGIVFGKASADVTAVDIGADGNLPSGTEFSVNNLSSDQVSAKSEGNFSGGTSKDITVVTDSDQKKLLASLASSLRSQAQQKLQATVKDKKVLADGLSESITKKAYSKNINDQASNFSLNLTIKYGGIAYSEADLKEIVSKLVSVDVPTGYQLDLADTVTQADVSKIENNKLTFLARFQAKLIPKIDTSDFKNKIRGQTPLQAADILKSYENVLGSDIKLTPTLPGSLSRLPLLDRNIQIEVSLK